MSTVTLEWIERNASGLSKDLEEIHSQVEGKEPTDDSIEPSQYKEARSIINDIEQASDSFFQAYVHVVDEEEIERRNRNPVPFAHYEAGFEALENATRAEIPEGLGFEWRQAFEEAQRKMREKLNEIPDY